MIYAYQYENLAYVYDDNGNPVLGPNGNQETMPNPQVNGTAGPAGDNYLYSHFQFDTQASYRLPWGLPGLWIRIKPEQRSIWLLQRGPTICRTARVLPSHVRGRGSLDFSSRIVFLS